MGGGLSAQSFCAAFPGLLLPLGAAGVPGLPFSVSPERRAGVPFTMAGQYQTSGAATSGLVGSMTNIDLPIERA